MIDVKDMLKGYNSEIANMSKEEIQAELMRLQIETYNASVGDLDKEDGLDCPKCKNKGWVQLLINGYVKMRKCGCVERRNVIMRAKRSGLGEYLDKDVDDYQVTEQWQANCKAALQDFIENHSKDNTWFLALGTSGCGKTLMCSIIANHLLYDEGRAVSYVTWTDFISRLKRDVMGDKTNKVSEYLEEIKKVDVLFLDELVKKYNETDLKYLIEIINYRYTNNLKTIITSERVLDDLLDIDEATFGRAVEKCEGYLINIPKDRSKNYRLRALR